ncbi:MAG: hypothetical protein R3A13_00305 [Bdellovibrionota bacterium]
MIISGPDEREGHENIYDESTDPIIGFWKKVMERWGSDDAYNEGVINLFNNQDHPEIIIVVDKLSLVLMHQGILSSTSLET